MKKPHFTIQKALEWCLKFINGAFKGNPDEICPELVPF